MPRLDRTFTGKDILRLFNQHLDSKEQTEVLIELCRGVKIEVFDDIALLVPELASRESIEELDIVEVLIEILLGAFL